MKKCINFAAENDILKGIEYEVGLFAEMMRLKLYIKINNVRGCNFMADDYKRFDGLTYNDYKKIG